MGDECSAGATGLTTPLPVSNRPELLLVDQRVLRVGAGSLETSVQAESGLYTSIALNCSSVLGPRSCSYTIPLWLTIKVFTPLTRYSAGAAARAKPPIIRPLVTKLISPNGAEGPWPFRILK